MKLTIDNEQALRIFIEGYLASRFDMLIDDELNTHLAVFSETSPQEEVDNAIDEFYNNKTIFDAALVRANAEMEAFYDTFVEFAVESWNAREELMTSNEPLLPALRQGGTIGEA